MKGVPSNLKNDPAFKLAQKKFFQENVSDSASQYNMATSKFFDDGNTGKVSVENTIGNKFQNVQAKIVPTNMEGEMYKRNEAKFYGEDAETRSQGSAFQANQTAFYGGEKAATGFKIQASQGLTQNGPQVNTKSGMFKKNEAAFYGNDKFEVESQGT